MESITSWTAWGQEPSLLLKWSVGSWTQFLKLTASLWRDAAPPVKTPSAEIPLLSFDHIAGKTETLRRAGQDGFAVRKFILAPQRRGWNEILQGLIGRSRGGGGTLRTDGGCKGFDGLNAVILRYTRVSSGWQQPYNASHTREDFDKRLPSDSLSHLRALRRVFSHRLVTDKTAKTGDLTGSIYNTATRLFRIMHLFEEKNGAGRDVALAAATIVCADICF